MSLTRGVIQEILSCPDPNNLPVNPVIQILCVKKIPAASGGQDRYRLVLSDGLHYYTSAMLSSQLNHMVQDDMVEVSAVIQMNRYNCNVVQQTRKIIILFELTIIQKASDVDGKIGQPTLLSEKEVQQAPVTNNQSSKPQNTSQQNSNTPRPSPYGKPNGSSFQSKPSSFQKPSYGSAPASSARNIFPIASLTPYQNRWTIRARVTTKSSIRTWSNSRGEGKLFSVDLVDESGEIKATGFNDVVDKFYDMLEAGKVYFFTKGTLKTANKQYSSLKNDYEMSLNSDSMIELCTEDCELPSLQFNFKQIKDVEQINKDALVDVVGVVKSATDVTQITTKATNKQVSKRDLTLVDQSKAAINATIWGLDAEKFQEYVDRCPVIAIKGAKVSDFGGRSLSILSSSVFQINPDIPEVHALRGWYDNGGMDQQVTSLSGQRMDGGGGAFKIIGQIKAENLGMGEKADYFNVRAVCVFLKKENCLYQACPGAECNKKVTDEGGQYRCEKCDRTYPDFKHRLILQSNIADFSGNQWITSFQESAETMLGVTAEQLGKIREEDENQFDKIFAEASFKPFILKIRAKMETYQDEPKLKCSSVSASPVNYKAECKRLLGEIKQLEAM